MGFHIAKLKRHADEGCIQLTIIRQRLVDASDDLTCKGVDAVFKADLEDRLNATQALLDAKSAELNRITLHGQHPNIGHGGKHSGSIGMQPGATGTIRWRGQVLVAGAALFALGYGIALVSKPTITPAKGVPVLQPKRGFGIASSVSGAIAGGVALKAFQSASASAASQSMSSGRPADAPNFALVRSSTNCIIAYVLAGTFAVLLTGLVVSMARLKVGNRYQTLFVS
ncbi:hypothetical protein PBRA_008366 [Plasmodiophora brassicae]|uniref:Uncharacterized protein n=1 Tax=Plasmodiophora brassicae TaxID=37360 RepID=A0A0G4J128_PLABS|nr:hypothetical protein PBRA_008366 [Plasmodiophora brassicae]